MRKSSLIIFILLVASHAVFAQFIVVPIPKKNQHKKSAKDQARIQALTPMPLPFWDDFSFSNSKIYPHDTLWEYGQSVDLNFGEGIHPPSLGVATFDGLDSVGRPYNIDAQAKGYADKLVSRPLDLQALPVALRDSVYLSFYYQFEGNGENPEPGDRFEVDFKNNLGEWVNVLSVQNDGSGTLNPDVFAPVILAIDQPEYFFDSFQFRFRAYGRLSGPYDTWNLDYVYVNSRRYPTDLVFPDRAIAMPLTSIFSEYWAIPKKHLISDINANIRKPIVELHNLKNVEQPFNYSYYTDIIAYKDDTKDSVSQSVEEVDTVNLGIPPQSWVNYQIDSILPLSGFDPAADSFKIKVKFGINTRDNIPPGGPLGGDYIASKYAPIDFRLNDTTAVEYISSSYYAYDDGSAEFGAGLNVVGSQFAYYFKMMTPDADTIVAVDLYFPRFEDESNRIILLRILSDLSDKEESRLYEESMLVQRSQNDSLVRHKLNRNTVVVQGGFYVGWKQMSAGLTLVGLDKNTDSGDRINVNVNGTWNHIVQRGSLMIHPVFGKGGVIVGVTEPAPEVHAYPNPNSGTFYISGLSEYVAICDLAGRSVGFSKEPVDEQTKIEMNHPSPGIYILKTLIGQKYTTQKIMIQP